jgi:hypothetical protein
MKKAAMPPSWSPLFTAAKIRTLQMTAPAERGKEAEEKQGIVYSVATIASDIHSDLSLRPHTISLSLSLTASQTLQTG